MPAHGIEMTEWIFPRACKANAALVAQNKTQRENSFSHCESSMEMGKPVLRGLVTLKATRRYFFL